MLAQTCQVKTSELEQLQRLRMLREDKVNALGRTWLNRTDQAVSEWSCVKASDSEVRQILKIS